MAEPDPSVTLNLISRLRLHAHELINGGANAGQLRADLNTAADELAALRSCEARITELQAVEEAIERAVLGKPVSDFMESFPIVRAVVCLQDEHSAAEARITDLEQQLDTLKALMPQVSIETGGTT